MTDAIPISSAKLDELLAQRREDVQRIAQLESELTEAKLQRDSWKRIAESGLGIAAETEGYENVSISKGAMCRTCETIPCRCQAKVEPGIGGNLISGGCYTPKTSSEHGK
jgi:hypothetical protein